MTDYLYYRLTGGIDLKSSKTALGQSQNNTFWTDGINVEIYKSGGVARMNGNTLLKSVPGNPIILGMFEYTKGNSRYLVLNTSEGKFYVLDSGNLEEKKSGLDISAKCNYVNFINGVICTNGKDDPFFFEKGVEPEIKPCNAVRNGQNIRGLAIASYKGRVWIGDGGTLYYSALGRFDDWTSVNDAGYISNFHNDSGRIVALKNYKEYLAIYKENQTYLLSGDDPETFAIIPFTDKGSISPFGVATIENSQYFYNGGVYTLEQVGELNQIRLSKELSGNIHPEFEKLDLVRLQETFIIPYEKKRQIWFYFPYRNNEFLNNCLIFDYDNRAWYRRAVPQNITCICVFGGNIITGTAEGEILIEDLGDSFNGSPISFRWQSPFFYFGEPNKRKTIDEFYITFDHVFDNNFLFSTRKDYISTEIYDQDNVNILDSVSLIWADDEALSGGEWADESSGKNWATETEVTERLCVSGSNKSVQLCIEGNQPAHGFAILGVEFRDVIMDE